jgi:prepilin-type N-terminal cleavage/methylation domain-containing protein
MGLRRPVLNRRGGYTLLELVVTLAILALAVALVAPAVGRGTRTIQARAEVARLTAMLRHAREQAITTGRRHTLVVDPAARRLLIVAGEDDVRETRAWAPEFTVEAASPAALAVRFEPAGVSSGGEFYVVSAGLRYRVSVEPLTGRVKAVRL